MLAATTVFASHFRRCAARPRSLLPMARSLSTSNGPQMRSIEGDCETVSPADYVRRIYALSSPEQRNFFSLNVTGGGVTALQWLLTVPGASSCIKAAQIPYSRTSSKEIYAEVSLSSAVSDALSQQLQTGTPTLSNNSNNSSNNNNNGNNNPNSHCSEAAAVRLAEAAYRSALYAVLEEDKATLRSLQLTREAQQCADNKNNNNNNNSASVSVFGVGCTAALASGAQRKGENRAYISIYSGQRVLTQCVRLARGARSREEEDHVVSLAVLRMIGEFVGLAPSLSPTLSTEAHTDSHSERESLPSALSLTHSGDSLTRRELSLSVSQSLQSLLCGERESVLLLPTHAQSCEQWLRCEDAPFPRNIIVFPGSFNPLHEGHVSMAVAAVSHVLQRTNATQKTNTQAERENEEVLVVFEVAARNADKPSLSLEALRSRLDQFSLDTPSLRPLLSHHSRTDSDTHIDAHRESRGKVVLAVCATASPLFAQKARLFGGREARFLVGADTLKRVVDLKYYVARDRAAHTITPADTQTHTHTQTDVSLSETQHAWCGFASAMSSLHAAQCSFLVCGRVADPAHETRSRAGSHTHTQLAKDTQAHKQTEQEEGENQKFETLETLLAESAPLRFAHSTHEGLFESISEDEFRADISSTILRRRAAEEQARKERREDV